MDRPRTCTHTLLYTTRAIVSTLFLYINVHRYLLIVEVKSIGVSVKENHIRGLCQMSLEMATVVEGKWVTCLIQECVIAKVL